MKLTLRLGILSLALLAQGCGDGTDRIDIEGTATFDDQPIPFGDVMFIPDQEQGHVAPAGSAAINDGTFSTAIDGQGIVPGPHTLRITAYPTMPVAMEDETAEILEVEPLFVDYTIQADITGPTFDIVVPGDAEGYNAYEAGSAEPVGDVP